MDHDVIKHFFFLIFLFFHCFTSKNDKIGSWVSKGMCVASIAPPSAAGNSSDP